MQTTRQNIRQNYDNQAERERNRVQRQHQRTFQLKSFNNWIKSVLIKEYTEEMCRRIQKDLDLPRGDRFGKLLHILDVGCGRGQDINKFRIARVSYMVAVDFSEQCIKKYEERWEERRRPYKLLTLAEDFTSKFLHGQIQHSYYDIVSSQFSFHYMFQTIAGLQRGLGNILSNLLIGGVFIATIPDSYTILKKVKQRGKQDENGKYVFSNKYFSLCFDKIQFENPIGNQYGFYLEDAVGSKNEDGTITYTNEWLVPLDYLEVQLKKQGVVIQTTQNFLNFYNRYKDKYRSLFTIFDLNYSEGEHMSEQLWEIVHLYRVIVCRKVEYGKTIHQFPLRKRIQSIKENKRQERVFSRDNYHDRNRGHNNRGRGHHNHHHRSHNNHHEHNNSERSRQRRN